MLFKSKRKPKKTKQIAVDYCFDSRKYCHPTYLSFSGAMSSRHHETSISTDTPSLDQPKDMDKEQHKIQDKIFPPLSHRSKLNIIRGVGKLDTGMRPPAVKPVSTQCEPQIPPSRDSNEPPQENQETNYEFLFSNLWPTPEEPVNKNLSSFKEVYKVSEQVDPHPKKPKDEETQEIEDIVHQMSELEIDIYQSYDLPLEAYVFTFKIAIFSIKSCRFFQDFLHAHNHTTDLGERLSILDEYIYSDCLHFANLLDCTLPKQTIKTQIVSGKHSIYDILEILLSEFFDTFKHSNQKVPFKIMENEQLACMECQKFHEKGFDKQMHHITLYYPHRVEDAIEKMMFFFDYPRICACIKSNEQTSVKMKTPNERCFYIKICGETDIDGQPMKIPYIVTSHKHKYTMKLTALIFETKKELYRPYFLFYEHLEKWMFFTKNGSIETDKVNEKWKLIRDFKPICAFYNTA